MKVGVVGLGGMGRVHSRHWASMPDVELTFFDREPSRVDEFSTQFIGSKAGSFEEMLSTVDAVDLCLPTDLHVEFAMKALDAKKHLLLEKPITRTNEDAAKLIEKAEGSGQVVMAGQVVRFFPEYAAAHRQVKAGKIGRPAALRMRRGGKMPSGTDNWFRDASRSGGVLLDLAVHEFDYILWTFGPVKAVTSRSLTQTAGFTNGDYALTTLELECGAVAHVESTWMDPSGFRSHFEFCGSDGMLQHDSRVDFSLRTFTDGNTAYESPMASTDDPFRKELQAFKSAVENNQESPISLREGAEAVRVALAAIESAQSGKVVNL
ncbi:MAG: Gfo/Idh/MocA family oxidoreductase [Armatimonadetes bacterium]|nr:Gfo/Idh/MocA family oxidoreductase [Armatimonadota bacterium]